MREMLTTIRAKKHLRNFITSIAVISPLLALYGVGISSITLLDVSLVASLLLIFLSEQQEHLTDLRGFRLWLFGCAGLVLANCLLLIWEYPNDVKLSMLLRSVRYAFYLFFCCVVLNKRFFNIRLAMRLFRFVAVFASVYLLVQYVLLYLANYSLPGYITWLPLMREELASFTENLTPGMHARPRSIFGEPSQFGLYAGGYLILSVFYRLREKDWVEKVLIGAALLLATSSTALLAIGFVAVDYLLRIYRKNKRLLRNVLLIGGAVCLLACLVSGFVRDRIVYFVTRFPTSFMGRLGGFLEYGQRVESFSFANILLGIGMDTRNMNLWYSGLIKILLYFGIVGTVIFALFVAKALLTAKPTQRWYMLAFLAMCIFSEVLASYWLIVFLPFVLRNWKGYEDGYSLTKWVLRQPFLAQHLKKSTKKRR